MRVRLPQDHDPALAALLLRGDAHPRALVGDWAGATAILASEPAEVAADGQSPCCRGGVAADGLSPGCHGGSTGPSEASRGGGPELVGGGWIGGLHYLLAREAEPVPAPPPRPVPLPLVTMARYDHAVVRDARGAWWFEALGDDHPRLDAWRARFAAGPGEPRGVDAGPLRLDGAAAAHHVAAVAEVRERIAAGDVFQVNVCLRLDGPWRGGDPLDLFARAAAALRPRHAAYVAGPWGALASLSPERFLRRHGRAVLTEPIKGTGSDPDALAASAKDRAENVMIADLMRNDLGRVCDFGSVAVEALAEPRPGPGVWHLVSAVRGTLRDGATDEDLLRATFPPGSCTGAPKVAAMAAIHELEPTAREAYTGAIGIVSPRAGLDLNVAIRTFEIAGGRVWMGAGGGITFGSDPAAELAEALAKAAGPVRAAGLTLDLRPDPALGLLETLRVTGGAAEHAEAHLARLGAPELLPRVRAAARGIAHGRLRIVVRDGEAEITAREEPPPSGEVVLRPVVVPGGLGERKWADRRLADALGPALLLDADGAVLEATWASVAAPDGRTPPADGRLLPGITRARGLAAGLLREAPLTLDDLRDGLLVLSAVGGPRVGRLEDAGAPASAAHARCADLRAALGFDASGTLEACAAASPSPASPR